MLNEAVLLVDSDPIFLRIVRRALEMAGYDVETANNGAEALQKALRNPCAVAVVDVQMPGGAGFIPKLHSHLPQTECILLTSDPDVTALVELYDAGNVYNHRWKPLDDIGDLARDIARALERRALKRQNAYLLMELRDARDELKRRTELLMQMQTLAALGQMAVDLAEGLDAPLQGLIGYADYLARLLAERPAHAWTEEQRQQMVSYAREMGQAADRCQSLMRRVRQIGGQAPLATEPVDLCLLLHQTLGLLRHSLESRGIRLKTDLAPELPLVEANVAKMQQVLLHLALNALHAMPNGGTLYLTTETLPGDPGGVRLRLRDTGAGIDPESLPHIFEAVPRQGPSANGDGLGLAIVRSVVREYGGEIAVDSVPGQGTTFALTFPAAPARTPPGAILEWVA